ncbi:MAG: acyl-CoA reductase [Bacteroidales bacterium]
MNISLQDRVFSFIELGKKFKKVSNANSLSGLSNAETELYNSIKNASHYNPWFTEENCRHAIAGLAEMLDKKYIEKWVSSYKFINDDFKKTVAVIMAGNVPAVGFHDMLCVLISGKKLIAKLSSNDKLIPKAIVSCLIEINPGWELLITIEENIIKAFDAVIATGSNNSARYFEYYFGKYPHIIRKNRNSLACLSGKESGEEFQKLAEDIFRYFGLGCRNVSQLLIPKGFNITTIFPHWERWSIIADHYKYSNNYDYNKSIFLINQIEHLDTGFLLVKKDERIFSPISVLNYYEYDNEGLIQDYIKTNKENIQCISSNMQLKVKEAQIVPLGNTQNPKIWDYADSVDTIKFCLSF